MPAAFRFALRFSLPAVLLAALLPAAHAQLLVSPSGGTVLFSSAVSHDDEVSANRSLGFTLGYFGTNHTTVDVSTNGNLNFAGDIDPSNVALPSSLARLDPYWDDLYLTAGAASSISEQKGTNYYAVTWNNLGDPTGSGTPPDPAHQTGSTFQAVLFGGNVTLSGYQFHAGDIAYSYQSLATPFDNYITVGLNAGDGTHYSAAPGTTNGIVTSPSTLPVSNGQFLLFRPLGGSISYTASVVAAPEPSAWAIFGAGVLGLSALTLRARKRGACA